MDGSPDATEHKFVDHVPMIIALFFCFIYAVIQLLAIFSHGADDIISARVQDIMVMIIGFYFGASYKRSASPPSK